MLRWLLGDRKDNKWTPTQPSQVFYVNWETTLSDLKKKQVPLKGKLPPNLIEIQNLPQTPSNMLRIVVITDTHGKHHHITMTILHHITMIPPYCPYLNPVESVWGIRL